MEKSTLIRVLIADDHSIVREGLVHLISSQSDMEVVGGASNGKEAVALYESLRPDVMLLDLRMPEMTGLAAIEEIRKRHPAALLIALTTYDTEEYLYRALRAGARSFLTKEAPGKEMLDAIRAVASGQMYIVPAVAARLAVRMVSPELSRRENEVLAHIASGKSNLEIATELYISEGTVKSHVNTILSKMHVTDRTQAVVEAVKRGLIVLE